MSHDLTIFARRHAPIRSCDLPNWKIAFDRHQHCQAFLFQNSLDSGAALLGKALHEQKCSSMGGIRQICVVHPMHQSHTSRSSPSTSPSQQKLRFGTALSIELWHWEPIHSCRNSQGSSCPCPWPFRLCFCLWFGLCLFPCSSCRQALPGPPRSTFHLQSAWKKPWSENRSATTSVAPLCSFGPIVPDWKISDK